MPLAGVAKRSTEKRADSDAFVLVRAMHMWHVTLHLDISVMASASYMLYVCTEGEECIALEDFPPLEILIARPSVLLAAGKDESLFDSSQSAVHQLCIPLHTYVSMCLHTLIVLHVLEKKFVEKLQ
jgi:hypothetical protein